jgi:hypothetical protein
VTSAAQVHVVESRAVPHFVGAVRKGAELASVTAALQEKNAHGFLALLKGTLFSPPGWIFVHAGESHRPQARLPVKNKRTCI